MVTNKKRGIRGHILRWCIILFMILVFIKLFTPPIPWSFESMVKHGIARLEVPMAEISSVITDEQGLTSVIVVDQENRMYHQLLTRKMYGLFWVYQGGSRAVKMDVDTVLHFQWGMSTVGNYKHYYYYDAVQDPHITSMRIVWFDGKEQEVTIQDGIAQAVHAVPVDDNSIEAASQYAKLYAYDSNGNLLYELSSDPEHYRIEKPKPGV